MRIISGKARGRILRAVPGDTTRPITDRTKVSLFNIIGGDIQGAAFLDLFAGTGSVGLEALSRGASFVCFVENNRNAIETIQKNLQSTGLVILEMQHTYDIHKGDVFQFLEKEPDRNFDYVYIAPPQYKGLWKRTLLTLDSHCEWLSLDAWSIVQIHPVEYEPINLANIVEFDTRRYGSTLLVFYKKYLRD
jgi:16S rRNA (guanine(966)-N(2))-methyltransferase RsmD